MNEFTQMLQTWQLFYATIATASATLAGLLFVSLSLNRDRLDEHARLFARSTFGNLINVLVLALIFLVPHQQPSGLSVALFAFGCASIVPVLAQAFQLFRHSHFRAAAAARLIALPLALSLAMLVLAIMIYKRQPTAMYWPIAIIVILLGSASTNAWEILFRE